MHGLGDNAERATSKFKYWLHPDQILIPIPLFENSESQTNLRHQVQVISSWIEEKTKGESFSDGYHLLCHSQGALLCRCISEYFDNHNIDTFISLAGPQLGTFGEYQLFNTSRYEGFEEIAVEEVYILFYLSYVQQSFSSAEMWHDPIHQSSYLVGNDLLPDFNGEKGPIPNYKNNFLRVKKAAFMVGELSSDVFDGEYEGGIEPWFSGIFSYYDSNMKRVDTKDHFIYKNDTFGLKTMDKRGDLRLQVVQGAQHQDWIEDEKIFKQYVLPLLT